MIPAGLTPYRDPATSAHGEALRLRFANHVEWLQLALQRRTLDAESAYDQVSRLLAVVGEMRWVDAYALQQPQTIQPGEVSQ